MIFLLILRWLAVVLLTGLVSLADAASAQGIAIVTQDQAALRAAPRDSAKPHAVLWRGEALEVRGERLDYLQVYDHRRERGGFVRASQVRRLLLTPDEAPELLAIVRHLRGTPGAEALGIGFAAAYIQAAPAEVLNGEGGVEALDALGTLADRLAQRASSAALPGKAAQTALSAHLDVAARHGVVFVTYEREARVQICYDGDAFRRVLAMRSNAEQRARAVLALTRPECAGGDLRVLERRRIDEWRAEVLDRVDAGDLPGYLRNRVLMRRATVWASLAYQRARSSDHPAAAAIGAAQRALAELAGVSKAELTDDDAKTYSYAAMRVNASRWAAVSMPVPAPAAPQGKAESRPRLVTLAGAPGETCLLLVDAKRDERRPLARRCTYGIVWTGSATLNREGSALAVAVQPTDTWRELWVFRKAGAEWTVRVLPPAATLPEVGYAEFAGWVPGGAQMLVAREALGEGKYLRNFELLRLDTLSPVRQASDPAVLGAFQRWQDPAWKRQTLALR
jgi:hypothetical protein